MGWDAMQQLRAQWEAINHRWNDWVLNYTRGDQAQLLQRLQLSQNLAVTLATALGCGMALLLAWLGLQRWRQHYIADPWLRLMHRARRRLAQAGISHADSLGLQALARAVQAQWGMIRAHCNSGCNRWNNGATHHMMRRHPVCAHCSAITAH